MNEVVEEWRLVNARVAGRQLVIPMSLDIPVGVGITRVVLHGARHFDLLETPLRQILVGALQIATKNFVLETESSCQSADSTSVSRGNVSDNLNLPVVLFVADSQVTVRGDFLVALGHGGGDVVRVQITASLGVDQTNGGAVANEAEIGGLRVVVGLAAIGIEEPIVVGIFVVIAGDLLLLGTLGVSLNVGVEKTTTVAHVLDSSTRAIGDFERAILSNFCAFQVGLEQRAHLGITRTGAIEDGKVKGKGEEVDEERDEDQSHGTSGDMGDQGRLSDVSLYHLQWCNSDGMRFQHLQWASWCCQTCSTNPRRCIDQPEQ